VSIGVRTMDERSSPRRRNPFGALWVVLSEIAVVIVVGILALIVAAVMTAIL